MQFQKEKNKKNTDILEFYNLIRLTEAQSKPASIVLARAFQNDPLMVCYFPDESERKVKLPYLMDILVHYGIKHGEVYATSPNFEGVSVWLPSNKAHMAPLRKFRCGGLTLIFKGKSKEISKQTNIDEYFYDIQERLVPEPHWYLLIMGVDPIFQGNGFGSNLLRPMFDRIDQENLPCFLKTENEKIIPIYQHYRFKVIYQILLPNTEIFNWAMLREVSS